VVADLCVVPTDEPVELLDAQLGGELAKLVPASRSGQGVVRRVEPIADHTGHAACLNWRFQRR
jgi:hypothetical protein